MSRCQARQTECAHVSDNTGTGGDRRVGGMQFDRPPQDVFELVFGQEPLPGVGQLPASH